MRLLSVNVGRPTPLPSAGGPGGLSGIDKRPFEGAVRVSDPGPKGTGGSGLAGDAVCDLRNHGGSDQAVYAFAREELDAWQRQLGGRELANGSFGENLTTLGVDVSGALIGERWRVGAELLLEVTSGRIPCRTFADHIGEEKWVRRFTQEAVTGAYLRVIEPGTIRAGDPVEIVHRPDHGITAALQFRAVTTERTLLPSLLVAASALHPEALHKAREYVARGGGSGARAGH
ncbi:MOSC domain-containing protein [Streptomyces microflavus]|uniref:MOSC domain-containing protein n=1 Tax=Streptomyces microflavus TaxID=1919 RepID=A0A6N9V552_STRMI|nr:MULTISPECIES: MOSC domain-containing protein [Streptomyces]MBW3360599.1 MOSC domain-containing protein [Streptomyces sp. 09ZI22]MEE1730866.1 MOSC domain-containing protein [Streptomyces sp. BE282]NEB68014.1 MOSC domain-containing protein [Streptomyces microflavus]OXY87245.1 sulfurase [Streptomyces sp. 2R]QKW44939.1 MOSC domain-containing protein [Streptomyces microflavus]